MPQSQANVELKSFSNGIVTEVNPLSGDISSASELNDWLLHNDGSIESRAGYTLEVAEDGALATATGYQTYIWRSPEYTDGSLYCLFTEGTLNVYSLLDDGSIGVNILTSNRAHYTLPLSVTEAGGQLIVCSNDSSYLNGNSHYLTTRRTGTGINDFESFSRVLHINDSFGVDDGMGNNQPPGGTFIGHIFFDGDSAQVHTETSLSNYNFLNQGWTRATLTGLARTQTHVTKSLLMSGGLDASNVFSDVLAKESAKLYGTGRAPYGKFIINATVRGASRKAEMAAIPGSTLIRTVAQYNALVPGDDVGTVSFNPNDMTNDQSVDGVFHTQAHSGRVFTIGEGFGVAFGDELSPDLNTMLFFSQSIVDRDSFAKAHSQNDLTAAEGNVVLATDGGFISLLEVGKVLKMFSINTSLLIASDNGIWEISSPETFTSSNYSVRKITTEVISSVESAVVIQGNLVYWTRSGIKMLVPDERTGRLTEVSLSDKIDSLYKELPVYDIISSIYDDVQGVARWLYDNNGTYNELVLHVGLGSYTINRLTELNNIGAVVPFDYISTRNKVGDANIQLMMMDTTFGGETVRAYRLDGNKVESTLVTNVSTFGDGTKRKQATYLNAFFRQTEQTVNAAELNNPSSCLTRVAWDFSDSIVSNKWSPEFQAYRLKRVNMPLVGGTYDYGRSVVETRNKVRGSGNALSIMMTSPVIQECHLYGVNMSILGNGRT